jgi:four helix bundle protein
MADSYSGFQPHGLRDLRAYQLAKRVAHMVYEATGDFARGEFRLVGQMRSAAVSVYGNIAEGYGRHAIGDYIRFCEIARGSLSEVGSYIEFCQERKMLQEEQSAQLQSTDNYAWNTLGALVRPLRNKKLDGSWDRTYSTREHKELNDA